MFSSKIDQCYKDSLITKRVKLNLYQAAVVRKANSAIQQILTFSTATERHKNIRDIELASSALTTNFHIHIPIGVE